MAGKLSDSNGSQIDSPITLDCKRIRCPPLIVDAVGRIRPHPIRQRSCHERRDPVAVARVPTPQAMDCARNGPRGDLPNLARFDGPGDQQLLWRIRPLGTGIFGLAEKASTLDPRRQLRQPPL